MGVKKKGGDKFRIEDFMPPKYLTEEQQAKRAEAFAKLDAFNAKMERKRALKNQTPLKNG